ncbi:winged helix-turn-helix domain-containing tetratricopeptide repeat protein [Pseudomarimonas salicorniae]|uniref:Winged helix-turn-helix domain-containing protein n=1 Tax=Pseudomarimonas salicorniae TaxID=2933270 RepID=A0ABT0GI62_9GAMM|nr:winged helix-turn-helix domain-containing protein [Lysobacter sp. CAU 1642]MCK7594220.1 winged helix-turn-helix domain-containing protein [Lysobacter sp. CAU 1642]
MRDPFRLADLTVLPDLNEIRRGDQHARLEPLVMDLLCLLAGQAGQVLGRDELLEQIWKDRYGADASLTRAISLLRKTFRDAGVEAEWIETVPKRGYRLAVAPERIEPFAGGDPPAPPAGLRRSPALQGLLAAAALLLALLGWGLWQREGGEAPVSGEASGPATAQAPRSIAVLPLLNHSADQDAYLTDALHDEILTQLARIGSMKVISRTSVMPFRDSDQQASAIAAQLGVRHLVEGSVLRAEDRIRVNIQLIDGRSDDHLWAQVFDHALTADGLFAIQSEIAEAVARQLDARITAAERARFSHRPTQNFEAYQAYLLGRQAFLRRTSDRVPGLQRALEHFDRALALEPNYADALAGKAAVHAVWPGYVAGPPDGRAIALAIEHAERALAIDPLLAQPHAVLGLVLDSGIERFTHLERAVELAPSDATAHLWTGLNHLVAGHLERGEASLLKARELDPTYPIVNQWLGVVADLHGDPNKALAYAEQGIAMGMNSARGLISVLRLREGDYASAGELFKAVVSPEEQAVLLRAVTAAVRDGQLGPDTIAAIRGPGGGHSIPHFRIAALAAVGAHDAALELIAQRLPVDITALAYVWHVGDPELRRLPLFETLARGLGLPAYWRANGFPPGCDALGQDGFRCTQ